MSQVNLIVNGSFDAGSKGWSGTDLETSFTEDAYLHNKSTNHVAEMDGNKGPVTVMQQTVKIDHAIDTQLNFRTALRSESLGNAGKDGFKVEILDEKGQVIASESFFPKSADWADAGMKVSFPSGGAYTVRFTELGPNDSLGAIVDDVTMLVCFVAGTLIRTDRGEVPVETLAPGDRVWTLDHGFLPLRWIGQRHLTRDDLARMPQLRPIWFDAGALGPGLPRRRMGLSPQHRVLRQGWQAELHFGTPQVLAPAAGLVNGRTIRQGGAEGGVTYVHFLLDGHQIVASEGVLSESFFPTAMALGGVDSAARAELALLFPDLASLSRAYPATARPSLRRREAALVA